MYLIGASIFDLSPRHFASLSACLLSSGQGARLPLYRAAQAGTIALVEIYRGISLLEVGQVLTILPAVKKPAIMIVADDDYEDTGPQGWASPNDLMDWAASIFIDAALGETKHYELAISSANTVGRVLFVETSTAWQAAWTTAAAERNKPTTLIAPIAPASHPSRPPSSCPCP